MSPVATVSQPCQQTRGEPADSGRREGKPDQAHPPTRIEGERKGWPSRATASTPRSPPGSARPNPPPTRPRGRVLHCSTEPFYSAKFSVLSDQNCGTTAACPTIPARQGLKITVLPIVFARFRAEPRVSLWFSHLATLNHAFYNGFCNFGDTFGGLPPSPEGGW